MINLDNLNVTLQARVEFRNNKYLIKYIRDFFKTCSYRQAATFLNYILTSHLPPYKITDICGKRYHYFYQYNMGMFNKNSDGEFILDTNASELILTYVYEYIKNNYYEEMNVTAEGKNILTKDLTYYNFIKHVCTENGEVDYVYDFGKGDIVTKTFEDTDLLQRCTIHISTLPVMFNFPIVNKYKCYRCRKVTTLKSYLTESTGGRISCMGMYVHPGTGNQNKCNTTLTPNKKLSVTKKCYYYSVSYDDKENNTVETIDGISFKHLLPGLYECVLFRSRFGERNGCHIVDVKPIRPVRFKLPDKTDGENYIFTLQRELDGFIKKQSGMGIRGLLPIKVALILQKGFDVCNFPKDCNIQLVGDQSTGKTLVLTYYGYALNNVMHKSTDGQSISIPGLRGTRVSINIGIKKIEIISTGLLGSCKSVHIDEARENKQLIIDLKSFLGKYNYSYDKAGSDGVVRKRMAHINLSENVDIDYVGQYRGSIRKAYRAIEEDKEKYGDKVDWDEKRDLHRPLWFYTDNPYLLKIIEEKRLEYKNKRQFWNDGYDYALHQRFPLYFYTVNEKDKNWIDETIKENKTGEVIRDSIELVRVLKTTTIDEFFNDIIQYKEGTNNNEGFNKVFSLMAAYNMDLDPRVKEFWCNVLIISRMINKRVLFNEEDYTLIQYLMENTNFKIDVSDTIVISIKGPPNLHELQQVTEKVESMKTLTSESEVTLDFDNPYS